MVWSVSAAAAPAAKQSAAPRVSARAVQRDNFYFMFSSSCFQMWSCKKACSFANSPFFAVYIHYHIIPPFFNTFSRGKSEDSRSDKKVTHFCKSEKRICQPAGPFLLFLLNQHPRLLRDGHPYFSFKNGIKRSPLK